MALYWVGGSDTWNATSGSKWSTTSGGAGGAAVPTSSDDVFFDAASGTVTVTLSGTLTASTLSCAGFTGSFTVGTSIIQVSGGSLIGNGKTFYTVQLSGTTYVTGANTFTNLTVTGSASFPSLLILSANQTISGTMTLNGNSTTKRLYITSDSSTVRTLTAATVSCTYADFRNIVGAGAGSWNLAAITGLSGNGGGNTGITFTTAQDNYWVGNGGSWSDVTNHWANATGGTANTGRIPLLQDTAYFDANSFTGAAEEVLFDMTRLSSIICTGVTDQPVLDFNRESIYFYGSLVLDDVVVTGLDSAYFTGGSEVVELGGGTDQLKLAGLELFEPGSLAEMYVDKGGGALALIDDMICTASTVVSLQILSGTFNINPNFLTVDNLLVLDGATFIMGLETVEITGSGTCFSVGSSATITPCNSTIKLTNNSTSDKTFAGGGKTYHNIWVATADTGVLNVTGANTFADIKADAGRTIKFTAGTNTTLETMTCTGTNGNNITIGSITSASHTLTHTGTKAISCDYLTLSYSTVTPGGVFFAGIHSTDSGNNLRWIFSDPANAISFSANF